MDDLLHTVVKVVARLNYVSEKELGCHLFRVEYVPNTVISICTSEFVIWNNEEEQYDDCDGSETSILSYVKLRLGEIQDEMGKIVEAYPSLSPGLMS